VSAASQQASQPAPARAHAATQKIFDDCGYGWVDEEKITELSGKEARFLIVRRAADREPIGFVHFRFSLQGDVVEAMEGGPALFVDDLQLTREAQRKGVGKLIMGLMELIARKQRMSFVMVRRAGSGCVEMRAGR
jgi:hypothetical protein